MELPREISTAPAFVPDNAVFATEPGPPGPPGDGDDQIPAHMLLQGTVRVKPRAKSVPCPKVDWPER